MIKGPAKLQECYRVNIGLKSNSQNRSKIRFVYRRIWFVELSIELGFFFCAASNLEAEEWIKRQFDEPAIEPQKGVKWI